MKWMVLKHYRLGPRVLEPGRVVDLTEVDARFINEDEPGTVRPADSADRMIETPPADRMVKGESKRVEMAKKPEISFGATKSGRKH